jgi:putative ABC transport system permease protein
MVRLMQNLRYAIRVLRKSPGYTTIALLTLGLGIGATTAIFSVVDAVLLRPLPYREPDRLVTVEHFYPSLNNLHAGISVPGFRDYRNQHQLFQSLAVENRWQPNLTGQGDPQRLQGMAVTGDFFGALGVATAAGRVIRPDEAEAGHDKVVVLSWGLWKREFGGSPAIVGQRLTLDGESYEVVGVMPASFRDFWSRRADLWRPLVFTPDQFSDNRRTNEFLNLIARLQPGVTPEQAQRELHGLATRLKADYPGVYSKDWDLLLTTLNDKATGNVRQALLVLLGAVGLVLLIACANVANLQLARAAGRSREIAVRVALGASPGSLVAQLLTESVVLALGGGLLGVTLAAWSLPALLALNPNSVPTSDIGINGAVLSFALALSLVTGVIFGLAPAVRVARLSLHETLKEGGRGAAGDRTGLALRRGLVVVTVALALMLLVGAGLLVRSFGRLLGVDPGFRPDHLLTFNVALPQSRYSSDTLQIHTLARISDVLATLPGVTAAGGTSVLPFGGSWSTSSFNIEGYQRPTNGPTPWGDIRVVTPGFLPALGARLLKGRQFTDQDASGTPQVAIVDDEMVRRYWPGQDPIGKRLTFQNLTDSSITWITVVGVVGHTMHEGLDGDRRIQLYLPLRQQSLPFMNEILRTSGDPVAMVRAARAAVLSVDPDLPLANVSTMEQLIEGTTGPRRFSMVLLAFFSGLAALLASVGLYGVMSYTVSQRSKELGVRLALGADRGAVLGLVLGQGMRLALLGVGIGLIAALALTRVLQRMLFDLSAYDPVTFVMIAVLLVLVTLLASGMPALRATRVDPVVVLREE